MWQDLLVEKSIFALFPKEVLHSFDVDKYTKNVLQGEVLIRSGQPVDKLIIGLDTSILQSMGSLSDTSSILGTIHPGRSANIYCFLRNLPSQYSFVTERTGTVLELPAHEIDRIFDLYPHVKNYLLKVTENVAMRALSETLRQSGVSNNFITHFISSLSEIELPPHSFLKSPETKMTSIYYLLDGRFVARSKDKKSSTWIVPLKSWIGWSEIVHQKQQNYSLSSVGRSLCLQISQESIHKIKIDFPVDFQIIDDWIHRGQINSPTENESDDEDEIENIQDLFEGSVDIKKKSWSLPFVKQNDEMDCGPACLAMISSYYGKEVSVHFWRSRLSTDKSGTSLYDLALATEKTGFISHCLAVEDITQLDGYLLPFIAIRKYHYLVVYKIRKDHVVVGDPAFGVRKMKIEEFNEGFENAGLFLKPNFDFLELQDSPSAWKHYLMLFKGLENELGLALACSILGVFVSLIPPIISQIALDEVLVQKDYDLLWILLGTALGVTVISSFINWAERYYYIYIMGKFNFRAMSVFVEKMMLLPFNFYSTRHVGDFTHRLSEMSSLRTFVTGTLFGVILNIISMALYGTALMLINFKVALIVFALSPPLLIIPALMSSRLTSLYGSIFQKSSSQFSFITDLIKGIPVVKSMKAELASRFRFESKLLSLVKTQNEYALTAMSVDVVTSGYHQFVHFSILGMTIYMGLTGELSAGKVISFSLIASRVYNPLLSLAKQWDSLIQMKSVLSRLNDVFLTPSDKLTKNSTQFKNQNDIKEIEFRDVWFRYGGDSTDWVLQGINFKIEKGQKVAIVGPSGSGKSTLALLLTRMYEPTKGQILIDGRDYREFDLEWIRKQIGLLHQESFLFEGTIAENIALNSFEIDEDRLNAAAIRATAMPVIEKKSNGFDYHIPYGGLGFSGGEKQKIALARIFYQNPTILVLDESTSALDGIAESEVLEHIKREMQSNTIFNIAHRYSTVLNSEFALLLVDGKVAGFGPIEHLRHNNLTFRRLFRLDDLESKSWGAA